MLNEILPLRSITKSKDVLEHEEDKIRDLDEVVNDRSRVIPKWPALVLVCCAWCPNNIHNDRIGQPVGCYSRLALIVASRVRYSPTYRGRTMS